VDPDVRRQGIGRKLVVAAERWAAIQGCVEMASDAHLWNTVSHEAHRALGYKEGNRLVHFRKALEPQEEAMGRSFVLPRLTLLGITGSFAVCHDGTTVRGLKELEEELKESFEADPKARLSVRIDSLRMVTPNVVIEEGKTEYFPDGKTLTAETDYQATHVKKGDRWLMTRVRSFNRVVLSPYDLLRDLEWLVGDWVDEGPDSVVETFYRWDANKAFLLQDFAVRVKGEKVLTGTQRIGRDPLSKQIKAWVFDSEGGYAESLWSPVNDTWVIKGKGVRADGTVVTVTTQITQMGKDRMRFESVDRIVGDERRPVFTAIVVRKPPEAKR
jgi:Acetyltransferase (GNAT) family